MKNDDTQHACGMCKWWDVFDSGEPVRKPMGEGDADMLKTVFGNNFDGTTIPNPDRLGWCHRYPPRFLSDSQQIELGGNPDSGDTGETNRHPVTQHEDYCGEWKCDTMSPLPAVRLDRLTGELFLSVRARRTLIRNNIDTVDKLRALYPDKIHDTKNCGPLTIIEILSVVVRLQRQ